MINVRYITIKPSLLTAEHIAWLEQQKEIYRRHHKIGAALDIVQNQLFDEAYIKVPEQQYNDEVQAMVEALQGTVVLRVDNNNSWIKQRQLEADMEANPEKYRGN